MRTSRTARILLLAGAGLLAILAVAADEPGEAKARAPAAEVRRSVGVGGLDVRIRVSRTAHLFHVVDNLSGVSPGKTRGVWLDAFERASGPLTDTDRGLLARYRSARLHRADNSRRPDLDTATCLAPGPSLPPVARRLSAAALAAGSDAALFAEIDRLLPERHAGAVRAALRHFGPRIEPLWRDAARLRPFADELAEFFEEKRTRGLIESMIRYLGAEIDGSVPVTISLIALPADGGTHAEAGLHHVLLEIRPRDDVASQVPVVFHELAHELVERVPPARRDAFARALLSRGPYGSLAWRLEREGLPTALGQGVAHQRLARHTFDRASRWYHLREIDEFAHAIVRDVARDLEKKRSVSERMPAVMTDAVASSRLARAPLGAFLGDPILAATARGMPAMARVERALQGRRTLRVRWDDPEGIAFVSRHDCAPLVVAATVKELAAMPDALRSTLPDVPAALRAGPGRLAGAIVTGRRPSGAPALLLIAATPDDRSRVAGAVGRTSGWPDTPVFVPRPAGSADRDPD